VSVAQLVPLNKSPLAGAGMNIPARPFELDPDWEVDPASLNIGEKIGALPRNAEGQDFVPKPKPVAKQRGEDQCAAAAPCSSTPLHAPSGAAQA